MLQNKIKYVIVFLGFLSAMYAYTADKEYSLSKNSEEYNTHYFYCSDLHRGSLNDDAIYMDKVLPSTFVVEIASLQDNKHIALLYNDTLELQISKEKGKYRINQYTVNRQTEGEQKLSFYFVNQKVLFYIDEEFAYEFPLQYDFKKRIGVKYERGNKSTSRFMNCYTPVPFKEADYGKALDDGNLNSARGIRVSPHNVGKDYCLTFPADVTSDSKRSVRFEYRFEDTQAENVNSMKRARSEISGVFCNSPRNKWIIEYDLLIPQETIDDKAHFEIITQIHKETKVPVSPAFCLNMLDGWLKCYIQGDSVPVGEWQGKRKTTHRSFPRLQRLTKDRWHHIKIYLKEGIQYSDMPVTKVWIDGVLKLESHQPNCFSYEPQRVGLYDYLKFGIYKSDWLSLQQCDERLSRRIYYFDNLVVKY